MFHTVKTSVKPYMKLSDLIDDNPLLLLMLQHFNIDFRVIDLTVSQLCSEYEISDNLFISIANLYNGFGTKENETFSKTDLLQVIDFLENTHVYYRSDKYPQIRTYITQLQQNHPAKELKLLEKFFDEYFNEVIEHLDYEDKIAFPYFITLLKKQKGKSDYVPYSSNDYNDHHTDIELKLQDLKNLLLKYVKIDGDLDLRRRLFFALYELEFDLYIHSQIEETILIPSGICIENEQEL
ncbi:MAG: hemerythrin domain-containing protein [Dysgonamonadaceae bacterium]|nr:hemerythrin domain-containing protein [Dysgonamonadaceae bacterium]MDD3310104.1 hemerythrin domain-containing protein [Dysgonamonadaceae bacterium]MDD3902005.1 hemerythrin domain-containing protein [Dysgonamonadaceae bacterium]MDD4398452.1 hemerythrin domain-containing protein [Dysgonamonadaceae bacterium]MEA5080056.1 hemerythrin domain-containing protein [Dysgonamonadaceae bacterium]